jgi:DNA-binding MarR family transcriptional regulator
VVPVTTDVRPGDRVPFLLSQVGARMSARWVELLAPIGVAPRCYAVLAHLGAHGPRTQQQLCDALGVHRNAMVGLVDELEQSGWASRHLTPRDRRVHEVRLTPAGAEVVRRVDALLPDLEAQTTADLDVAEREQLRALLSRVGVTLGCTPGVHPHLQQLPRHLPEPVHQQRQPGPTAPRP